MAPGEKPASRRKRDIQCSATGVPLIVEMSMPPRGIGLFIAGVGVFDEEDGESLGDVGALRFFFGEEDLDVRVSAAQIGDEGTVREDDARAYAAGERRRCVSAAAGQRRRAPYGFAGSVAASWRSPGGQGRRLPGHLAQRAQEVDGRGHGELRGSEVSGEVAAADFAALFHRLQHVVDGGEAAGQVFRVRGLAEDDAVAIEELLRDGVPPFCGACRVLLGAKAAACSAQRPCAVGGVVRRERKLA